MTAESTVELTADVVVVGAGPAGAATALMLAPRHRTLLLDRADPEAPSPPAGRIGESLPAAARRLLRDMGLLSAFEAQGHAPCHGASSLWGGPDPISTDAVRDPDGPGWHLDRARFDAWLRREACARGTALVAPAQFAGLTRTTGGWRLRLIRYGRPLTVAARFVVDAGGRAAPVARALGRRRLRDDRLVCRWLHGLAVGEPGRTLVVAEPEGWWYSAALPAGRRMLAFHTDADLPAARDAAEATALLRRAMAQPGLGALLGAVGFAPAGPAGVCAAHGSRLDDPAGAGWLAVGDAALSCDPLSSQGLLDALYFARMAAGAVEGALVGAEDAVVAYRQAVDHVARAYRRHHGAWYALEGRWRERPFWARRHGTSHATVAARHEHAPEEVEG